MHTIWRSTPVTGTARRLVFPEPHCIISWRPLSTSTDTSEASRANAPSHVRLPRVYGPNLRSQPVPLRTLYHKWLTAEDYVDLSDARGIIVDPKTGIAPGFSISAPYITYGRSDHSRQGSLLIKYFPFPVNTRGHFYYRRHPKFPIGGALRFRLTQNPNPSGETFASAQDLLNQYGTPWQIPLLALASSLRYEVVRDVLHLDGFLLEGVVEHLQDMCDRLEERKQIGPFSQFIYDTLQPFVLDLARLGTRVTLVGQKDLIPVDQGEMWDVKRFGRPFESGILLCNFEAHGGSSVYMRVLRVIEPVRMAEGYTGPISQPVVGDYIRNDGKPKRFLQRHIEAGGPSIYTKWKDRNPRSQWAHLWNWATYRRRAMKMGIHFPYDKEAVPAPSARW